ncbi:MAG TPA: hypothetical protein PKY63_05090 [Bacteroidales bacterium]|nr:hypothetical protein [Bacteroidales bacterium]
MKKIFFILLIGFAATSLFAQDNEQKAIDELNLWSNDYNSALDYYYEIKDKKEDSPEICNKAKEAYKLFNSAIQHCENAKNYFPEFSKDINLYLAETYSFMGWFNLIKAPCVTNIFSDDVFNSCMKKAFEYRPFRSTVSLSDLKLDYYKQDKLNSLYGDQVYLGYMNSGKQSNLGNRREYALEYINILKSEYGTDYINIITSDTSKTHQFIRLNNIVKVSEEYLRDEELIESKIIMEELYAAWLANKKLSDPDAGFSQNDVDRLEKADKILAALKDDGTSANTDQQLVRLYNANMIMDEKKIANDYLTEAKLHDHSSIDELYDYIEKTKAWRDETSETDDRATAKDRIRRACNLIYEKMSTYSTSADYERLLAYYQYIDDSNGISTVQQKIAEKKEEERKEQRREKLRSNWGLSVGIAPGKLIWQAKYNQLSLHADLVTAGFSHGFRYCKYDLYTDKSRFGAYGVDDGEPGDNNTYSGWEGSWWINFKAVSGTKIFNFSPFLEFRYGQYEFNSITTSVIDRETDMYAFTNVPVDPIGKRFDVTYGMKGTFTILNRFYFQTVFGFGLGYRWLETGYDNEKYALECVNFSDERWPKVTVPFRIGFRAGIRLF